MNAAAERQSCRKGTKIHTHLTTRLTVSMGHLKPSDTTGSNVVQPNDRVWAGRRTCASISACVWCVCVFVCVIIQGNEAEIPNTAFLFCFVI